MNNTIIDNTTLNRIRELCDSRKWSIYKLAKEADIPYSSLNNIFIRNTHPTVPTLRKICDGFGITLSEFFQDNVPSDITLRFTSLSDSESYIVETYRSLNDRDKQILMAYMQGLAKQF